MTAPNLPDDLAAFSAAPDLTRACAMWLRMLASERKLAALTIEAYGRDARQFLGFLAGRLGAPPSVADFAACAPADLRAYLARRRADGIDPRSLQRALSALRSLGRASRAPAPDAVGAQRRCARHAPAAACRGRSRSLDARAVATTALRDGEARDPWVLARDAAVLALCYGAGLRICEALSLRRATRRSATSTS